jgi:hypothetical protein
MPENFDDEIWKKRWGKEMDYTMNESLDTDMSRKATMST